MEESAVESSENHQSDGDFEKIPYPVPGDEDPLDGKNKDSLGTASEEPLVAPVSRDPVEERQAGKGKTKKAKLESRDDAQEGHKKTHSWTTGLDPSVLDLIYWRDVKKTGIVLAISLVILIIFAIFPLLSIISYTSLLVLTITFSFRLYGNIISYIKKSKEPHILSKYLEKDINIPVDSIHRFADQLVTNVLKVVDDIRKLFLVERFLDSIKFALLLWLLTFIGSWFSGISVIIIGDIILFSVPKFYQVYQKQIDEYILLANAKLDFLVKMVQEKLQRKSKEE